MIRYLLASVLALAACTDTFAYDPATAGDPEGGAHELRAKTSSQFLRTVYADLLGRTPESYDFTLEINGVEQFKLPIDEERELVNTLDGIGDSMPMRNLIVAGLLHSTEVSIPDKAAAGDAKVYITTQFERLLGREPNAYELEAFAAEWAKEPAVGPRTVIRAIIGSREYQSQ